MCVYLHTKFQLSSIPLTGFRQGVILTSPPPLLHTHTSKRTPKKPTQIRVKHREITDRLSHLLVCHCLICYIAITLDVPEQCKFPR